jgi:transcriptional regulator GlxA family with amidase domain
VGVEVTDYLSRLVFGTAQAMLDPDREDLLIEDRLCALTQMSFDQSWQWTARGGEFTGPELPRRDFRIRKALKLMQETVGEAMELDHVAREVGLSRPHFFKLFRTQVGLTPNLYANALRMERAIERLAVTGEAVAEIGFDLGFSSQASFSRFFIANGVVPPSAYRRSVHVA